MCSAAKSASGYVQIPTLATTPATVSRDSESNFIVAHMNRQLAIFVFVLALMCGCNRFVSKTNEQPSAVHSKATLIVDHSAVTPGSVVNLGIQFVTDSGWHMYWRNPGDSGEPPRMQWNLPSGITVGEMQWPTPARMTSSAGTDYGYQGTITLLTSLKIPATAQAGVVNVGGDLRWLVCHDVCLPQRMHLEVPILIGSTNTVIDSAQEQLQSASQHLPKELDAAYRPEASGTKDGFKLSIASSRPIAQMQFFPEEEEQIDNAAPQGFSSQPGNASLTLKRSEYLKESPKELRGVIVVNGRDAYELEAPIRNTTAQQRSPQK